MLLRFLVLCAAGILSVAQQRNTADVNCAARTSATGYNDTPVIPGQKWRVHDINRPHPRVITPGSKPGDPPSDAITLFDGQNLSKWTGREKGPAPGWKVGNGYVEVVGGSGDLVSKESFGDAQYHIEWATPNPPCGSSQWRGNSGILIMGRYEIQVLDSYKDVTYADGQAAAIYGQWPPLVNACREPGNWQTYDIAFEAPRFEGAKVAKPAHVTIFHNGVLVHHQQQIIGAVAHRAVGVYAPHAAEEPLALQDHDTPVRYRNIWVRRIAGYDQR